MGFLFKGYGRIVMPSSKYFFEAISYTKDKDQFTDGEIDKDYIPYIMNRMVAQYRDLVFFADDMNVSMNISKTHQIDFYMSVIPKKKRRALWTQKENNDAIEIIMNYYNISYDKAEPYLRILSEEQVGQLETRLNIGGRE
jgi:chromosomal replication initiation ATPase DnaA